MMTQEEIYQKYYVDEVFFVGVSMNRKSIVWEATEKKTNKIVAIRYYQDQNLPRPEYDQWVETTMLDPKRQLIAYYPKRLVNAIGNPKLNNYQQLDLMIRICKRLHSYHKKGKIHGNLHPRNLMFTHDFKVVDFMDSLRNGNKGTFYSSPQNEQQRVGTWVDVYALGVMFYELLSGVRLDDSQKFNQKVQPFKNLLFPEERHLELVQSWDCKRFLKAILNRNYLQRPTLPQTIKYLEQMRRGHIISPFPLPDNLILIKLAVLEDEKQKEDNQVESMPIYTRPQDLKSPFSFRDLHNNFKCKTQLKFNKRGILFQYVFAKKELKVTAGFASAITMTVVFKSNQVPRQVREFMDMELWVLVLYNTPEELYDFSLNGKVWISVSADFEQLQLQSFDS